jgi:hypothetical protein
MFNKLKFWKIYKYSKSEEKKEYKRKNLERTK